MWEEYWQDQEINDRGIGVDMEMVAQAIAMDGRSKSELSAAMQKLTELENPNSVQQMKQWLSENGMETDSLDKKAVAELLKTAPEPLGLPGDPCEHPRLDCGKVRHDELPSVLRHESRADELY